MPARPRRTPRRRAAPTALELACVVVVLLAVVLLLAYVIANWSTGRTNVLG